MLHKLSIEFFESLSASVFQQGSIFGVYQKIAQRESCELSFMWGKMRTTAREAALQIALRNCSKEVGGKVNIYVIGEGGVHAIKHTFLQKVAASLVKVTASHKEQMSPWKILVLF